MILASIRSNLPDILFRCSKVLTIKDATSFSLDVILSRHSLDFSNKLGVQKVILGQSYNVNPPRILYEFDDAGQVESKSRKKSKIKIDRKFHLNILTPTLFSEFYSDAYFDGTIETCNMENETCLAWDLTTLINHAKSLENASPDIAIDARLKNLDIWIIENGLWVQGEYNLVLINKPYFEKDPIAALSKILALLDASNKLPDEQLIDQDNTQSQSFETAQTFLYNL